MTPTWTETLWNCAAATYESILQHPFLLGLTAGELDPQCFVYYLAQDVHYLRDYARALAILAARAPTRTASGLFARHAAGTIDVELALHQTLLPQLGLDPAELDAIAISPTTLSYTSYLLATAYGGSFLEGLAAVLPCYWIYARVGATLIERGSPDARYQQWIDTYGGEDFAGVVTDVLSFADDAAPDLTTAESTSCQRHFATTSRYEWMFWDAAWRLEQWPMI